MTRHGDPEAFVNYAIASATDACIEWPFAIGTHGYGVIQRRGQLRKATHLVLEATSGSKPEMQIHACHAPIICHNRSCINPRHLRWDTPRENGADRRRDAGRKPLDPHETLRTWGKNLGRFRTAYGFTQTYVADELQVSQSTIARWENGDVEPRRPMKVRLADLYNTDVAILFPLTRAEA